MALGVGGGNSAATVDIGPLVMPGDTIPLIFGGNMRTVCAGILAILLMSPGLARAAENSQASKGVVLAFYKLALGDKKPTEAFARYAAEGFVEHSADSPTGTAQSTVAFLSGMIEKSPQAKWEIVRVIAEGDLVFLHVRFTPAPGAPPVIVGEIFRVHGGKLAEHWDIIQPSPEHPVNPNPII